MHSSAGSGGAGGVAPSDYPETKGESTATGFQRFKVCLFAYLRILLEIFFYSSRML